MTWGSGTAGVTGYVSSDNSLIGSSGGYDSGFGGPFITVLPSGNYVVRGPIWHDESLDYVGAVTWGSGTAGVTGYVSSVNSLVGCQDLDYVGDDGVTVLGNGNYVVVSSYWSNGTMYNAGAVTWGSGTAGVKGVVSSSNSLIGSSADDRIGSGGVTALSNGNYLTFSPSWDNGTIADVGALTWSSGMVGVTGAVSSDNSLVGSASDSVGRGSIKPLSNGNYVVCDPYWGDGRGAATWCNGTTALTGEFTYANSLVGDRPNDPGIPISQDGDRVGSGGVVELANGNYVVCSPNWFLSRGAVTWGSGTAGVTGVVSMDNSLVGNSGGYNWYTTVGDFVGDIVKPLSNGNFLVWTSHYKNGTVANAGAVTLGDGIGGVTGAISGLNSLIGPFTTDPIVNEASNSYFIGLQSPEVIATGTLGDRLTTTVISSANPSFYGNLVNFTALVPTGATGTVTFMDGNSTLGTGIISNGIATLSAVALGVGKHSIVAEYGGDNAHPSSTSMSMVQSVNRAWVPPTLTSSPNPSVAATLVTFTAKVPMDATGTVTFKSDNVVLGTSTISNGIATFSTASLSRGDHAIIVNYQGDSNYQPSMSKSFTQSVILSNVAGLATFLQEDRNTEGTWKPLYGADGFDLSQDQSKNNPSLPAYAGLAFANAQGYTWNSSTTNPRALQKPPLGSPDRIAATWYSASKFSFDVYLNQAQTHQITLYALDWDLGGRSELIQVFDTAKGTLLDSHSLDGFSHGVYLSWNIQGNVTFVVSNLTNSPNAVLSALFFGGAPQASGQATFVSTNSTTQGTWTEKYGAEGFDVSQDPSAVNPSFPSYASVNFANASNAVWSRTTSEVRALQKANIGQGGRIAGTWFSGDSFSINIKVNDGKTHQVALYALDWDSTIRTETIQVIETATGTVIDTRSLSGFHNGVYLVWNVQGDVIFKVTNTNAASNAVLSGLFFGGSTEPLPPPKPGTLDLDTQGDWKGVYGTDGFNISQDTSSGNPSMPSYATVSMNDASNYVWSPTTYQDRALLKVAPLTTIYNRIAAAWFSREVFTLNVAINDSKVHRFALYALDWDISGRSELIEMLDPATGKVLDSIKLENFERGVYMIWNISGNVTYRITNLGSSNAVISGLFFN